MASFPLSQLWASGKRLKNSSNPPAKHRRGRPAVILAPAATSPGPASAAVSPPIFLQHPRLRRLLLLWPSHNLPCFIHLMDSPQRSISSYSACLGVRPQLCHVSTSSSPLCRH
ncbi:hypothetical protein ATANTOWER_024356 [Ataeniobius toweri]|uniref:Uncharacterized protein n=1 Tax=Ataeniobius toweri TaxID=208326 RepID=A0ABU7AQT1_9TELE|nr:hypothetical protein [Ataeniobius toweri]